MADSEYTFIYGLVDPRDNKVRYIGKANNINKRLCGHIGDMNRKVTPVSCWIKKLHSMNLTPTAKQLMRVSASNWQEAEILTIEQYRRSTPNLLNVADGGDQPYCSKEQRQKNGANNAKKIHNDPVRKELWRLKKNIGLALKQGYIKDSTKIKLKSLAMKYPQLFSQWSNI